ncbi:MAG: tetratricopeptide repeat protein [Deltaproteobacteria bacterium]|nr:tetratricopeptide repeat protein [Deltaproteobacteria bacterium]
MSLTPACYAVALFLAICIAPNFANACACCDGGNQREVVGWSESGRSALVRSRGTGCSDTLVFEIMRQSQNEPVGCFDAYSETPSRRIACTGFVNGFDRDDEEGDRPTTTPRQRAYPQVPDEIAASHVRATIDIPIEGETGRRSTTLRVYVFKDGEWLPVFSRSFVLGRPEQDVTFEGLSADDETVVGAALSLSVRLWPNPDGRRALVEIGGQDADPGMGFFPDEMFWVSLPENSLPRVSPETAQPSYATPPMSTERAGRVERVAAHRLNMRALRVHRSRHFSRAAGLFTAALYIDPADAVARYNLACALAQMGQLEPALALLQELANSDCSRCRERLRRARVDQDLRALRPRLGAMH